MMLHAACIRYARLLARTPCQRNHSVAVECLESLSAVEVEAAYQSVEGNGVVSITIDPKLPAGLLFEPTIDGVELTAEPWQLAARGVLAPNVSLVAGTFCFLIQGDDATHHCFAIHVVCWLIRS